MIVLIDNYDSFSYNLYQLLGTIEPDIKVVRNDSVTVEQLESMHPDAVIISPGPGRPADAGICEDVIKALGPRIPILGVCLGHQAICEAYGATITYAKKLMHGKQSRIRFTADPIFEGLEQNIPVARYHSLAVKSDTLPECLEAIASADDGEIMAVKHREYPTYGLQFHPESVMTPDGMMMLKNFIRIAKKG